MSPGLKKKHFVSSTTYFSELTRKCSNEAGVHLRDLAPGQHCFDLRRNVVAVTGR